MSIKTLVVILFGMSAACCLDYDCLPANDFFTFTYTSKDGEDLLGGSTKKYEAEELLIIAINKRGDTIVTEVGIKDCSEIGYCATTLLQSDAGTQFLKVKGEITDTLGFEFEMVNSTCCGRISKIGRISLNDTLVADRNSVIQIVERD